jgi:RNA polymerase sigma-70 factor (ECF subfamily)
MLEPPDEFEALMRRVRLGDREALAQLLQRYQAEVQQAAARLLGRALRSYLDPADLVQSVHRTLIVGLRENKFEIPNAQKLVALAVTLARNKVVRAVRHRQCEQRHQAALAETSLDMGGTTRQAADGDPARAAEYHDLVEALRNSLGETDRRLVELRLQGYSTADIGRQLGVSADVLRVRLSRLRKDLRDRGLLTEWL